MENDKLKTQQSPISSARWFRVVLGGWYHAFHNIQSTIFSVLDHGKSRPARIFLILIALIVVWFAYVPVHELLHVAGCIVTGGTVEELVMGKEYGAEFLSNFFPFITARTTKYAGRLTGFQPNGDIGYLITDFAPFLLTIFPGVLCLKLARKYSSAWLLAAGIVIGLAPFYNLLGDYFEMGTVISTRLLNDVSGGVPDRTIESFRLIRSDDLFRLFGEMRDAPAGYGLNSITGILFSGSAVVTGMILAIILSGWTFHAGWFLSRWFERNTESTLS